jgi:hypothetical protein
LLQALAQEVGDVPEAPSATPGELARATLLLLAEDASRQEELRDLLSNPPAGKFGADPVTLTLLGTAALVVLQTHLKIDYDPKKGFRIKVEKRPLDKSLLGQVIGVLKRLFVGA